MDTFKTFYFGLKPADRAAFVAAICAEAPCLSTTSLGYLNNVAYGFKTASPALAVAIEKHSRRAVRRWEFRPDDWFAIWPELVGRKGAPPVPEFTGGRVAEMGATA